MLFKNTPEGHSLCEAHEMVVDQIEGDKSGSQSRSSQALPLCGVFHKSAKATKALSLSLFQRALKD